ncbi:hypothetical protein CG747_45245 [Streptomyces sp. CB02959]|uniref:DUF3631 domain-containing protein n=1 Tax=Streptomyces sp. CB02959 TaxID=2020330 RepID=UPI000C27CACF|nr:DUF3631 domain-containing protein [Streptomyces sp. CB02959]PJN30980.1 hypothetical protein CG747_45245 [Streptomyces sp. CB02959]
MSEALSVEPAQAIQHHLLIAEVVQSCQDLDQQLDALVGDCADSIEAIDQPDLFTRLLLERLRLEQELNRLLCMPCGSFDVVAEGETEPTEDNDVLRCPSRLVHACLDAFAAAGDPPAMSSADLVDSLRSLPGVAREQGPYAGLTHIRLAQLLAYYNVHPCIMPGGADGKGYRRSVLLAALQGCVC